ncbi:MAG: hypothetical protein IJ572_02610 [Bacilli bacterium]|nr:hypothetical protein [Bacilli bacterium]
MNEKKNNMPLIIIIMVLCLCLGIAVGYIIFDKTKESNNNVQPSKVEDTKNLNNTDNNNSKSASYNNKSSETNNTDNKVNLVFDKNLVINTSLDKDAEYIDTKSQKPKGLYYIENYVVNKNIVTIKFSWNMMLQAYGIENLNYKPKQYDGEFATFEIQFTKNVKEVHYYSNCTGVGEEVVLFLMEDNTVEFIYLEKAIKNNDFKSQGVLPNVNDIAKFYYVDIKANLGSSCTTWAQRNDGKIYELKPFIMDIVHK